MHRGVRIDGPTVKRLRKLKGLSQQQLASAAGIAERTVRNAETSHVLESHIASYLAIALDVPLNEIVSERATHSRAGRLKSLIRKVSSLYLKAVLDCETQSLIEIAHPNIEWNCFAAPDQSFAGSFCGVKQLRLHLGRAAQWWEQYGACASELKVRRADAEGEMIYFLLSGKAQDETGRAVEIWQTFICRFDENLLFSVDHSIGVIAWNKDEAHKRITNRDS